MYIIFCLNILFKEIFWQTFRNNKKVHLRFKESDTSRERIEGSAWMSSFDSQKLCESIEKNPTTSKRILSREWGILIQQFILTLKD